jgi:hypothetical protein
MDTSALVVVLTGTLLFVGFALGMGIYSRTEARRKSSPPGSPERAATPEY